MPFFRLKHSFTAGELSPLMNDRVDFERYRNGCKTLTNMFCATQGPAVRRSGFEFVFDLNTIGVDTNDPALRMIPFIFNETQAYTMIFYRHTAGDARMVLGYTNSAGESGLVTGSGQPCDYDPGAPVIPTDEVVTLFLPADWDIEKFDWAQSADEMYIAQPDLNPHIIKRHEHACWELVSVTFTDQPDDWSDEYGWPEKVTFHQQRIAFASNLLRRQTVWMSKAGDFSDFGVSSPLVDSDAVTFTLDSGTQNRIQWITSGKSLHVGTLGNEWTVSGNDQSSLTPSNILAQRQTNSGSEPNKPLLVGLTTLFVERHGRTVNEFVYDYTFDSYKTSDMAILSPHVTEFYSITDWTYQQTPDSIIWCVREDGRMLGITYQRQHKVVGWHQHHTDGEFKVVTCIPGRTREDDVWTVVQRTIDGVVKLYVEKLADWFKSESANDGRFLDSFLVYKGDPESQITGAVHLRNTLCDVLADGTVHPPVMVDVEGKFILNKEYSHVVIGLPYESEVRPHLTDADTRDGTSRGRTQRITNITIDLYRSLGMYIGRYDIEDGDKEEEVPFRVPGDLMGQAVPLYTGWYDLSFPEGYDEEAEYFIKQKQPLPLTVRGVVDEVEVHE
jgi:hypothetical protein